MISSRIELVSCRFVVRTELDMMVVVKNRERPFEQRFHAIPSYNNSGPSYTFPALTMLLCPRLSFKNPVLMPRNLVCPVCLAIGV